MTTVTRHRLPWWVLLSFCALMSCSPSNRYALVEQSLRQHDPVQAAHIIERAKDEYGQNSQVLYAMDRGMTLHLAGAYVDSNAVLEDAEEQLERLFTRHVTTETASFLTTDGRLPYEGDPYEQTMINVVKALNYARLANWTDALVEARRIDHRLNVLTDRGSAKDVSRDDPFARYLTGILYEATGDLNNAFIAYRRAYDEYQRRLAWGQISLPVTLRSDLLRTAEALHVTEAVDEYRRKFTDAVWLPYADTRRLAQIVLITFNGMAPKKVDRFVDVPISLDALNLVLLSSAVNQTQPSTAPERRTVESVLYGLNGHVIRIAVPALIPQKTSVHYADITWNGSGTIHVTSERLYDLAAVAEKTFKDRLPGIATKAVARAVVKYGMAESVGRGSAVAVGHNTGPFIEALVGAIAKSLAAASETADTRSWRTLPDEIHLARFWVPAGQCQVNIQAFGRDGKVLSENLRTLTVHQGETTVLTEQIPY